MNLQDQIIYFFNKTEMPNSSRETGLQSCNTQRRGSILEIVNAREVL